MKIVTIVGTRPQFIKMVKLSKKFKENNITEIIIHTKQHYDKNMSNIFFEELNIPSPNYYLNNINSNNCLNNLTNMILSISKILLKENPKYVIVYGDCDTTLAGALAANKLDFKIIHIESGLRSYDKSMPEEINRILVDHISSILLCPTENAKNNLLKENIYENIHIVGDLMIELLDENLNKINDKNILNKYNLIKNQYYLLTIHRKSNTNLKRLQYIFNELSLLKYKIIFPIHPRTSKLLDSIILPQNIDIIDPLNYLDMMIIANYSKMIITDSGGLQKEAYYLEKPCITVRQNTEWQETLENKMNILAYDDIYNKITKFQNFGKYNNDYLKNTSQKIIDIILKY